jgi:hypothetical protein
VAAPQPDTAVLSVHNWNWQKRLDALEAQWAKLCKEKDLQYEKLIKEINDWMNLAQNTDLQKKQIEKSMADEHACHEKEEAALRQVIAEGAQRERLLIFQRDAGSQPAPQGRFYEGEAEILPLENRAKADDPIDELYGD